MTEVQMVRKLTDQYERGMMTRDEFWVEMLRIRAEVTGRELETPVEIFARSHPDGWLPRR